MNRAGRDPIPILCGLLLATCTGLGGCVSLAAHYIEQPGHDRPSARFVKILEDTPPNYQMRDFHTADGLRISYWYGKPQALDITDKITVRRGRVATNFSWEPPQDQRPPPARGSVVLLHSWGLNATQMVYWGLHFTNAGYVVVMPDLRSQGNSGDAPIGYGPREADDIEQLVHALQDRHALPAPLYLFGYSYGATVALFMAPGLPEVRGVVAMAPYVHPVDVIERAPRTTLFTPHWWPGFLPSTALQKAFSPHVMHEAITRADHKLGIDLAKIDPSAALTQSHACTLLVRGDDDSLTSRGAGLALAAMSPRAQFMPVPHANHVTLFLRTDLLFQPIARWMQAISAGQATPCPAFNAHTEDAATAQPASAPER